MKHNLPLSQKVEYIAGETDAIVATILGMVATYITPLPEAVLTGNAIQSVFELSPFWAFSVSASMEVLAIKINDYHLKAKAYNEEELRYQQQSGRKTLRHSLVPEGQRATTLYHICTGGIITATAIYNVYTGSSPLKLLAILFPIASAIGIITLNRAAQLHRRQANKTAELRRTSTSKSSETSETSESPSESSEFPSEYEEKKEVPNYIIPTLEFFAANPSETYVAAGEAIGKTDRCASGHMSKAQDMGLAHRNAAEEWIVTYHFGNGKGE